VAEEDEPARTIDARGAKGVQAGAGNIQFNVHVDGRPTARSAYHYQVRAIAPDMLVGREAELADLESFCTGTDTGAYLWLRAEPWAGKTALLSWFVLNPPPAVRVVSFFITAGQAAQSDRNAFLDVVIEQLASMLDEPVPAFLTDATRASHLWAKLDTAAVLCADRGQRLVLVVDGLDEDAQADVHSIAALLPARPVAGMRVIVAGRHDPPVPSDVPAKHPLRDPAVERTLAASPHAQDIRREAERELMRLLRGAHIGQDLLGLVTAAGGGLNGRELAELTGQSWEIEESLHAVAGRTFARRPAPGWSEPNSPEQVYVLGHEELRSAAVRFLGEARLSGYRQRLHDWAQRYQRDRWPAGTPDYLLHGYFQMLHATGDVARMVACVTDLARRVRMLDLSGGDAAAFAEIITTQDVIVAQEHPDVIAMVRLAIHRDHLINQNRDIPYRLPTVWALLGRFNRAEAVARSIPYRQGWGLQASALLSVTEATADAGHLDHAEAIACSIAEPFEQAVAVAAVAQAAAEAGDLDRADMLFVRAETIARSITHLNQQARAVASVAQAAAEAGDLDRADTLLGRAETIARSIAESYSRAGALLSVAEATAKAGDLDRARAIARFITDPERQASALASVAGTTAEAGNLDQAEAIAGAITDTYWQPKALASVAGAAGEVGDLDRARALIVRAEVIAGSNTKLERQAWDLVSVAVAAARAGDLDRAAALVARAEAIARSITADSRLMRDQQAGVLVSVAEGAAEIGDFDRAEAIADSITVSKQQAWAMAAVAEVAARAGDLDRAGTLIVRAEAVVRSVPEPFQQAKTVRALASAVDAATDAGDLGGAGALIVRAEAVARSITTSEDRTSAMVAVAEAVAKAGDLDRAVTIAVSDTDPYWQAWGLKRVGEVAARVGDFDRAATLIMRAKTIARSFADSLPHSDQRGYQRARGLESSAAAAARTVERGRAEAAARAGDLDRAEVIASSLTSEDEARVLVSMAEATAKAGDLHRAAKLLVRVEALAHSVRATGPMRSTRVIRNHLSEEANVRVLALLADAVAKVGDIDRAGALIVRAEDIARAITVTEAQARALLSVADAVAKVGDVDRASTMIGHAAEIAHSIGNSYTRAGVLAAVAEAAAKAGDLDRAETIADSIDTVVTPEDRARALLAATETADLRRRARAVARALRIADWHLPIRQLIEVAPDAVATVLAEFDAVTNPDAS
jgi:tetratricopeptide (TPR) repeat protein